MLNCAGESRSDNVLASIRVLEKPTALFLEERLQDLDVTLDYLA